MALFDSSDEEEFGPPQPKASVVVSSNEEEESSSEEDVGPALPDSILGKRKRPPTEQIPQPAKKQFIAKRLAELDEVALNELPSAPMYEKSFMHRDVLTHLLVTPKSHFLVTASKEGIVKFWKKMEIGVEFAKVYRAHVGMLTGMAVSQDGHRLATVGKDQWLSIFDVVAFDMITKLKLTFPPTTCEWIHAKNCPLSVLAVGTTESGTIRLFRPEQHREVFGKLEKHKESVHLIKYNGPYGVVISMDASGAILLWDPKTLKFPTGVMKFRFKMETDLYAFKKAKTRPLSLTISDDGSKFACFCSDQHIRVFDFLSGNIIAQYHEKSTYYQEEQSWEESIYKVDVIDFGRRMAVERDLDRQIAEDYLTPFCPEVVFDEKARYILYPTMVGIKIVKLETDEVVELLGKEETGLRVVKMALFQGCANKLGSSILSALDVRGLDAESSSVAKRKMNDPTLICSAFQKPRFYLFTKRPPTDVEGSQNSTGRDALNEKPLKNRPNVFTPAIQRNLGKSAILRTSYGDIYIDLFGKECPKTVENFTTHAMNKYYDGCIFHRCIKNFMIQTGCPKGDGTGGASIWGGEFDDEFHRSLRHDRPGTLSMANAGPDSNGSQFFITSRECPWLDNKHTIFGRVTRGMDVVQKIEVLKTNKSHKPFEKVKILSIEIKK